IVVRERVQADARLEEVAGTGAIRAAEVMAARRRGLVTLLAGVYRTVAAEGGDRHGRGRAGRRGGGCRRRRRGGRRRGAPAGGGGRRERGPGDGRVVVAARRRGRDCRRASQEEQPLRAGGGGPHREHASGQQLLGGRGAARRRRHERDGADRGRRFHRASSSRRTGCLPPRPKGGPFAYLLAPRCASWEEKGENCVTAGETAVRFLF